MDRIQVPSEGTLWPLIPVNEMQDGCIQVPAGIESLLIKLMFEPVSIMQEYIFLYVFLNFVLSLAWQIICGSWLDILIRFRKSGFLYIREKGGSLCVLLLFNEILSMTIPVLVSVKSSTTGSSSPRILINVRASWRASTSPVWTIALVVSITCILEVSLPPFVIII